MKKIISLKIIATIALLLGLCVLMLGAYTRLTDAGLGCPDWPGCYGQMVLSGETSKLNAAQSQYPDQPIETEKAWTEMAHRYAAGTLAILIVLMGLLVWNLRSKKVSISWHLPAILVALVVFQALLGMWTVTLKLLPVVVMAHLLGGMLIFACLFRFRVQLGLWTTEDYPTVHFWLRLGFFIVFCQIALGGWVTANYAGIACIGFPQCNGLWLPEIHFTQGFNLFSPVGANYQGGLLDNEVRVSIQFIHRVGALITALYLAGLSIYIISKTKSTPLRLGAGIVLSLLLVQFCLGIINVIYLLPLSTAVAHNGVAALLLAVLFTLLHFTKRRTGNVC